MGYRSHDLYPRIRYMRLSSKVLPLRYAYGDPELLYPTGRAASNL